MGVRRHPEGTRSVWRDTKKNIKQERGIRQSSKDWRLPLSFITIIFIIMSSSLLAAGCLLVLGGPILALFGSGSRAAAPRRQRQCGRPATHTVEQRCFDDG